MIEPDIQQAAKEIRQLHCALDGVLMCARNGGIAYNLAVVTRSRLRQIHRLMVGDSFINDCEVEIDE